MTLTQKILEFFRNNPGKFFNCYQLGRALNTAVANILPVLRALRTQRAVRHRGASCCINQRYWGI